MLLFSNEILSGQPSLPGLSIVYSSKGLYTVMGFLSKLSITGHKTIKVYHE
jgi:hypothetical protein